MKKFRILLPVALCSLLALAFAAAASAAPNQLMALEAREFYNSDLRMPALDETQSLGVKTVRVRIQWSDVAPSPNSRKKPQFNAADSNAYGGKFADFDFLFAQLAARGLQANVTITGPAPKWATRAKRDQLTYPNPKEFEAFVRAVGARYANTVHMWSIWNEPNLAKFLKPQFDKKGKAVSPRLYRSLYLAAVRGLKATGNRSDTILFGETSPVGHSIAVAPVRFLRESLCLNKQYKRVGNCGRLKIAGFAHHAYTPKAGPYFKPRRKEDAPIGALERMANALNRAARAKAVNADVPLYLTECGIQSHPDIFSGVPQSQQAEFISMAERVAYLNPRVALYSQYLLRDDMPRGGPTAPLSVRYSGFESGLRTSDGRAKPALAAFRLPLVVSTSGSTNVIWGRVRDTIGVTRVMIQRQDHRGGAWIDLHEAVTNSQGVYGFGTPKHKGRLYRASWQPQQPGSSVVFGPPVRAYRSGWVGPGNPK